MEDFYNSTEEQGRKISFNVASLVAGLGLICHLGASDGEMQPCISNGLFKEGHLAPTPEIPSTKKILAILDTLWVKPKKYHNTFPFSKYGYAQWL